MFGESDSESPRAPSPWDSLISTPPSPAMKACDILSNIPKLAPEAEEGNIEYKLQLLSPSPARFARLTTQLKWRLLEGGGQAFYELGVADCGTLVGLHRAELEQSLETLEMMAGEIGASVIVVKEVEVPAIMVGLAGLEADNRNAKRNGSDIAILGPYEDAEMLGSTTEGETEPSTTDADDESEPDCNILVFSMDPEEDHSTTVLPEPRSSFDLEIASVYKPRPMLKHPPAHFLRAMSHSKHRRRHPSPTKNRKLPLALDEREDTKELSQNKQQAQFQKRRAARDRKREEKRSTLHTQTGLTEVTSSPELAKSAIETDKLDVLVGPEDFEKTTQTLVHDLDALHVSIETPQKPLDDVDEILDGIRDSAAANINLSSVVSPLGSRLIVEALVVRKLSLDEAFLDFGGFSLT